jgi:hypothetical protein
MVITAVKIKRVNNNLMILLTLLQICQAFNGVVPSEIPWRCMFEFDH